MISMIDSFKYTFGVEFEFFNVTRSDVKEALDKVGIESEIQLYNHVTSKVWKLVWDSSVTSTGTEYFINLHGERTKAGVELVSPVLYGADGIEQLRTPVQILDDLAKTFNSLDEADPLRAEITTNIGGKLRSSYLSSLLKNWDVYKKQLKDTTEGAGSAMREANLCLVVQ